MKTKFAWLFTAIFVLAFAAYGAAPAAADRFLQDMPTQTPDADSTLTPVTDITLVPDLEQTATPDLESTATPITPSDGTAAEPQLGAQGAFQAGVLAEFQQQLTELYHHVEPSVVSITIYGSPNAGGQFGGFPGGPQQGQQQGQPDIVPLGAGSGFVWDEQGHVVTNNHVVANAEQVEVTFYDGTTLNATVVGTDPDSDLAVVRIEDTQSVQLQPIQLSALDNVEVGQLAVAIGNPFGLRGTMTVGIVSAVGRTLPAGTGPTSYAIPSIIQTDAPINPGNSGGVLVNIQGELIGVPSAITSTSGSGSGVGFAIPADIVSRVVPSLIENGSFEHAYLGISGTPLTPAVAEQMGLDRSTRGVLVIETAPNGPAAQAGLQGGDQTINVNGQQMPIGGDVITQVNGRNVESMDDLINYLTLSADPGDQITLTVIQDGKRVPLTVTLSARPQAEQVPETGSPQDFFTPPGNDQDQDQDQGSQPGSGNQIRLGVLIGALTPDLAQQLNVPQGTNGVFVSEVVPGSPAEKGGLMSGDVITTFGGEAIGAPGDLVRALRDVEVGDEVSVIVIRDGEQEQLNVTFELPSATEQP